jgi:hypothetical protein
LNFQELQYPSMDLAEVWRCGEIAVVKTFQLKLASPESSEPQGHPWTAALRQPSQVRQRCDEEVSIERLYVAWWRRLAGHVHQNTWYIQGRLQYLIMFVISKDPLTLFDTVCNTLCQYLY